MVKITQEKRFNPRESMVSFLKKSAFSLYDNLNSSETEFSGTEKQTAFLDKSKKLLEKENSIEDRLQNHYKAMSPLLIRVERARFTHALITPFNRKIITRSSRKSKNNVKNLLGEIDQRFYATALVHTIYGEVKTFAIQENLDPSRSDFTNRIAIRIEECLAGKNVCWGWKSISNQGLNLLPEKREEWFDGSDKTWQPVWSASANLLSVNRIKQLIKHFCQHQQPQDLRFPFKTRLNIWPQYDWSEGDGLHHVPVYFRSLWGDLNDDQWYKIANASLLEEPDIASKIMNLEEKYEKDIEKNQKVGSLLIDVNPDKLLRLFWNNFFETDFLEWKDVREKALASFTKVLDQEWIDLSKKTPCVGLTYNWLAQTGDNCIKTIYRKQALQSYPFLITAAKHPDLNLSQDKSTTALNIINKTIDNAGSLEEALSSAFNIPVWMVRSMKGLISGNSVSEWDELTGFEWTRINQAFGRVQEVQKWLPKEMFPQQGGGISIKEQWIGFFNTLDLLEHMKQNHLIHNSTSLILKGGGFWKKQFFQPCIGIHWQINDMVDALIRQILFPAVWDACKDWEDDLPDWHEMTGFLTAKFSSSSDYTDHDSALFRALLSNYSVPRIIEISDYWHKNQSKIDASIAKGSIDHTWPALFKDTVINGVEVVCLHNAYSLVDEGSSMQHCVGSYISECLKNRTHIIGLRLEGKRLSTIEMSYHLNEGSEIGDSLSLDNIESISIEQNLGFKNSQPGSRAVEVANALLAGLKSGSIPIDLNLLETELQKRSQISKINWSTQVSEVVGYDVTDNHSRNVALNAWNFARPKHLRALDYEQWMQHLEIPQLIQKLIGDQKLRSNPKQSI